MSSAYLLIRKDFVLIQKMMLIFIPYYIIMGLFTDATGLTMFALFPAMLLLVNSCSLDVQHHNLRFVASLPVSRSLVVRAKYLALIPYAVFSIVCTLALTFVAGAIGKEWSLLTWRETVVFAVVFAVLAAIYLPLHYWLGQKGAQVVNLVFIMSIMFSASAFANLRDWFPALDTWMTTGASGAGIPLVLTVLGCAVVVYASYLISLHVYTSKDI